MPVVPSPAYAFTRYEPTLAPTDFTFSPGAGQASGHSAVLWSTGAASAYLDATDPVHTLTFSARAQLCEGAPHLQVAVDGATILTQEVDGLGYYSVRVAWLAGRHKLTFRFLDDHRTSTCDRNVLISYITFFGPREDGTDEPQYTSSTLQRQYVTVEPASAGNTTVDRAKLWNNGSLRFRLDSLYGYYVYVGFVASGCGGRRAHVMVTLDGAVIYDAEPGEGYHGVEVSRSFLDGPHQFVLTMTRDPNTPTCDGNVAIIGTAFDGQTDA